MNEKNEKLLDDNYTAWCNHDLEAIANCFADNCVYEDMAMGVNFNGIKEVCGFAQEVFKTMPDFHVAYIKRFATDSHGAGQWVITATWNGEFEGVDCTGKKIQFTGLSYYEFRDGKIAYAQDCWDFSVMMQTFGVLRESLRNLK